MALGRRKVLATHQVRCPWPMKTAPDGGRLMTAILSSFHMRTADDLFGNPAGKSQEGQVDRCGHSVGEEDHGED
jgi:hypothetical protein